MNVLRLSKKNRFEVLRLDEDEEQNQGKQLEDKTKSTPCLKDTADSSLTKTKSTLDVRCLKPNKKQLKHPLTDLEIKDKDFNAKSQKSQILNHGNVNHVSKTTKNKNLKHKENKTSQGINIKIGKQLEDKNKTSLRSKDKVDNTLTIKKLMEDVHCLETNNNQLKHQLMDQEIKHKILIAENENHVSNLNEQITFLKEKLMKSEIENETLSNNIAENRVEFLQTTMTAIDENRVLQSRLKDMKNTYETQALMLNKRISDMEVMLQHNSEELVDEKHTCSKLKEMLIDYDEIIMIQKNIIEIVRSNIFHKEIDNILWCYKQHEIAVKMEKEKYSLSEEITSLNNSLSHKDFELNKRERKLFDSIDEIRSLTNEINDMKIENIKCTEMINVLNGKDEKMSEYISMFTKWKKFSILHRKREFHC